MGEDKGKEGADAAAGIRTEEKDRVAADDDIIQRRFVVRRKD